MSLLGSSAPFKQTGKESFNNLFSDLVSIYTVIPAAVLGGALGYYWGDSVKAALVGAGIGGLAAYASTKAELNG